ncbi:MAG: bifunctional nicotinamidase/pyrazinamidase [Acidobacteriota bacterium]|nr:bifunctional nicotinamidase/pyrazinamidase [Acidobacteriota bacterium]
MRSAFCMKRALILVDVQNDFMPGGALPVAEGDRIVPVVNRLQDAFGCIVATQDWHPRGHGSFASQHPGRKPGDVIDLNEIEQVLWPDHCVQGSTGAEFHAQLDRRRIAEVFHKGVDPDIDSYSGLFDNGHRRGTGLAEFLKSNGVTDVYIAGLATDYCVKFTALDARGLGYNVFVIEDACRGVNLQPGDSVAAFEEMRRAGVEVVTSATIAPQNRKEIACEEQSLRSR